jgi:uncharacterized protein YndB with AHSA1/START domain
MDTTEGQLREHEGRWQLRFTRRLAHPPERVWRALTERDELAVWFPSAIEGERRVGAPLRFVFAHAGVDPIDGEMLAYDPPSLLEFTWGRRHAAVRAGAGRRRHGADARRHVRRARQGRA